MLEEGSKKDLAIIVNGAYLDRPSKYIRQMERLNNISIMLGRDGIKFEMIPIYFEGNNEKEIHDNLADQVKEKIKEIMGRNVVFYGGDGFVGSMINAWGTVKDDLSEKDANRNLVDEINRPVMAAGGGSYNLFARRLDTNELEDIAKFSKVEPHIVSVKRRIMRLLDQNSTPENPVNQHSYPFIFFAGTGSDANMVLNQEMQPRTRHWAFNTIKITSMAVKDFWAKNGEFELNTYVTIPFFGVMKLPKYMDSFDKKALFRLRAQGDNALQTTMIMLFSHLSTTNKFTSNLYFGRKNPGVNPDMVESVDRQVIPRNHKDGICFYTDGFPMIYKMPRRKDKALLSIDTVDGADVNMASYNAIDNPQETVSFGWEVAQNMAHDLLYDLGVLEPRGV